jgi:hypothetical protein
MGVIDVNNGKDLFLQLVLLNFLKKKFFPKKRLWSFLGDTQKNKH